MEIIRATHLAQQAGAYYVRIQGMARQHHISLQEEFDEHDTPETKYIVVMDEYLPIATCEAEKWAKELGFTRAMLESREEKVHFYEKMGYQPDWSKQSDGTFHCILMEKPLN